MTKLSRAHNQTFRKAAKLIVTETQKAGGEKNDIMVVLESVIAVVLLTTHANNSRMSAAMLEEGIVPGVIERLAAHEQRQSK